MCSATLQTFINEVKAYPTVPVVLGLGAGGAAYLARRGVRLCFSAALTIDKVKAAACILGAIYIAVGIILTTDVLLIHPDKYESLHKDLDKNPDTAHFVRFLATPMFVFVSPIACFLRKGIFES